MLAVVGLIDLLIVAVVPVITKSLASDMLVTCCIAVNIQVPVFPLLDVAVILAVPLDFTVTFPVWSTVATVVLLLVQVNVLLLTSVLSGFIVVCAICSGGYGKNARGVRGRGGDRFQARRYNRKVMRR